jgi:hypothetical protein
MTGYQTELAETAAHDFEGWERDKDLDAKFTVSGLAPHLSGIAIAYKLMKFSKEELVERVERMAAATIEEGSDISLLSRMIETIEDADKFLEDAKTVVDAAHARLIVATAAWELRHPEASSQPRAAT